MALRAQKKDKGRGAPAMGLANGRPKNEKNFRDGNCSLGIVNAGEAGFI
jgi:hypothetical protein